MKRPEPVRVVAVSSVVTPFVELHLVVAGLCGLVGVGEACWRRSRRVGRRRGEEVTSPV